MRSNKTILLDCDDVIANLVPTWLSFYNADYSDNLKPEDITQWDITRFVKSECGHKIYDYLTEESYDLVEPIEKSLWGVEQLKSLGYVIKYVTAFNPDTVGRKFYWLKEHGFNPVHNEYISCMDKRLIRGEYLLDDNASNITSFNHFGKGVLFNKSWNSYASCSPRVNNWKETVGFFQRELDGSND